MRKKIVLRNLYISQAIIFVFLVFAYLVWFPHSFAKLGGFNKTALMLIFVDLVLGPLLVFIVYREGKKYLTFDINVLLGIQLFAFAFGAYSLFLKHPAYAVFSGDQFTLTNVSHIHPQQHWLEQFKTSFFSSPQLVVTKAPQNNKKRNDLIFSILLESAPDIDKRPEYFESFIENIDAVFSKSIPINLLFQDSKAREKLDQFLKKHDKQANDYAYFPLSGNSKKDMIWVFDRSTAKPVGIIDSNPWAMTNKQAQIQSRLP